MADRGILAASILLLVIFSPFTASAQTDIAKIVSPKYELLVDGATYEIHYGYHGSLESDIEELKTEILPEVVSMSANPERRSLQIVLDNVKEQQIFWVMIPFNVLSAKGDDFLLLIDGVETGYEFTKSPNDNTIGMIVPVGAENVEIMGSAVIPEFDAVLLVSLLAFVPVVLSRKLRKIKTGSMKEIRLPR